MYINKWLIIGFKLDHNNNYFIIITLFKCLRLARRWKHRDRGGGGSRRRFWGRRIGRRSGEK